MNANVMKTNNGKLLAAVAIFAMLACVFAVAIPAADAADVEDTTYGGTYAADPAIRGDATSAIMTEAAQLSFLNQDKAEYTYDSSLQLFSTTVKFFTIIEPQSSDVVCCAKFIHWDIALALQL